MYHQLNGPQNVISLRPTTTTAVAKYDHTKENAYLERIARLMQTDRATLDSYAKIKLWEDGPNYQQVVKYVNNSQCHPNTKLTVVNIHRVWQRNRDDENLFHISNRQFLWHGTKRANIPQILKDGFKLPAHAGQMFGSGIYFADRISKSSNYSDMDVTFLLLCEVGLGKVYSCKRSHNDWKSAPAGFDSVKANGTYVPDWTDDGRYFGAKIPFGRTAKCTKYVTHAVNYNEFIVYDPSRVVIRFLVEVKVERMYTPLDLVTPKSVATKSKKDGSENSRTKTNSSNRTPASICTSTSTLKRSIDVRSTATNKVISSYTPTGASQTTTNTFTRSVDIRSSAVKTVSWNRTPTATQATTKTFTRSNDPQLASSRATVVPTQKDGSENSRTKTNSSNRTPASIFTSTSKLKRSIDVRSTATNKVISSYTPTGASQTTTNTFIRSVDIRSSAVKTVSWNRTPTATQATTKTFTRSNDPQLASSRATVVPTHVSSPSRASTLRSANSMESYNAREEYPQKIYYVQPSVLNDPVYHQPSYSRRENGTNCTIL